MRFDTPIYFQQITAGEYDTATGNYKEDSITEVKQNASVTDSSSEMLRLIYGKLKQGSLTIRLQNQVKTPFDRIRVDKKLYQVDKVRTLRTKQVLIVSEVQHGKNKN